MHLCTTAFAWELGILLPMEIAGFLKMDASQDQPEIRPVFECAAMFATFGITSSPIKD